MDIHHSIYKKGKFAWAPLVHIGLKVKSLCKLLVFQNLVELLEIFLQLHNAWLFHYSWKSLFTTIFFFQESVDSFCHLPRAPNCGYHV